MNLRSSHQLLVPPFQFLDEALELFQTNNDRGLGVRTTRRISKRTVVVEYCGVLLSEEEGARMEQLYAKRGETHCYMFWFRGMCLDATNNSHISRYINHSRKRPNLVPRLKVVQGVPRIIFKAKMDLEPGTELLFDYGDKRRDVVDANTWLLE